MNHKAAKGITGATVLYITIHLTHCYYTADSFKQPELENLNSKLTIISYDSFQNIVNANLPADTSVTHLQDSIKKQK